MHRMTIVVGLLALPTLAAAQAQEEEEGANVVFVDHSEVEIVVEESGTEPTDPNADADTATPTTDGTPFVEHQEPAEPVPAAPAQGTAAQGTAQAQAELNLDVPSPQLRISNERRLLRARLAEYPLGGPITMVVVGIPITLIFSYGAYIAYHVEDVVGCTFDDCTMEQPNRTATAVLGTIAGAGLVLGVVGIVQLIRRVRARAAVRAEFRAGQLTQRGPGAAVAPPDLALVRF